jgi:hypothetical protein
MRVECGEVGGCVGAQTSCVKIGGKEMMVKVVSRRVDVGLTYWVETERHRRRALGSC